MKPYQDEDFYCQICASMSTHHLMYKKNNIPIFRCKICGVGRAKIEGFDPKNYYTEKYFKGEYREAYVDYLGSEAVLRKEFRQTVQYLRRIGSPNGKCLEIGCAYGFFLKEARPYYEIYGVEMSATAVRHCWAAGLQNVRQGELTQDFLREIGTLDVVVMLDVIEHINDLEALISLFCKYLKPGAVVLLTTGDWSSPLARLARASWRLISPPGHIWYLTPDSLDMLMHRYGLMRKDIGYPWKIVPIDLILKQALGMMGWRRHIHVPNFFRKYGIPANLFDTMRLVYYKTD